MSVNAIVTVPSDAEDADRSGRDSLTASAISSTDLVMKNPCSSFDDGTEPCHCTSFHSPCSRCSTHVKRSSTGPSDASNSALPPAHPTLSSLIACTSPTNLQG